MFYSCSHSSHPKATTLNAISHPQQSEEAEARARHLAACREMMELGMELTRDAARRARNTAEPEPHPQAGQSETDPEPSPPPRNTRDPVLAFTRLCRIVHQTITLEQQTLAGSAFRFNKSSAGQMPDTEIRELSSIIDHSTLSSALERLTEDHPDRWNLQETIEQTVEETFADYPQDPLPTHFTRACQILGLTPDFTTLPHHIAAALRPRTLPLPDS